MFLNVIDHCQILVEVDRQRMLLLRHRLQFLGTFATFRTATISFVMFVFPSVLSPARVKQLCSDWMIF